MWDPLYVGISENKKADFQANELSISQSSTKINKNITFDALNNIKKKIMDT